MPGQAEARGNALSQDPGAPGPSWGNSWDSSVFPPQQPGLPGLLWVVFLRLCLDFSHFTGCLQSPAWPPTPTGQGQSPRAGTRPGSTLQLDVGVPPPGEAGLLAFWELVYRLARAPENSVGGKGKFGRGWQRVREREARSTPPEMGRPWAWTQQGCQALSQAVPSVGLSLLWTQGGALARS